MPEQEPSTVLPPGQESYGYDADALVVRLKRNAIVSLVVIAIFVAAIWRQPMPVVGALLGGALVMLNFIFLERLATRMLGAAKPAANPLQLVILAFRLVLMALTLYGIFALPGVHPIPVALGLSILVLAVVIEMFSEVVSAPPPGV
jgi:hypothetical protein